MTSGAKLGVLLGLQLPDPEPVYKELKGLMGQIITDSPVARASRVVVVESLVGL